MAFPCNQFGGQEPGTDEEIKQHVQEKYGVTFDMMSKINVNGPSQIPLYEWMKSTEPGKNQAIKWNFTNFVIDRLVFFTILTNLNQFLTKFDNFSQKFIEL